MTGNSRTSELSTALSSLRGWFIAVAAFSGVINLLALTGSIFMLQVYDRVLTSRSVPTLVALAILAGGLYAIQGVLEISRSRLLVRTGSRVDQLLGARIFGASLALPLRMKAGSAVAQPVRDLDSIRGFLSGQGPVALFDIPWIPIYLTFVFILHPLLGWLATAGALILIATTAVTERRSHKPSELAQREAIKRHALAEAGRRNAESLHAMGFAHRMTERWSVANERHLHAHQQASDVTGSLGSAAKIFRMVLQSAMLATGAWLTILGEVSGGAIIASSIVSSRALAPIDTAIAHWKGLLSARSARDRIKKVLAALPAQKVPMPLPAPTRTLDVEELCVAPPGSTQAIVQNVNFRLTAGQGLGLIGHSAAGKSCLARALVGAWPPLRGTLRLDGAAIEQWHPQALGPHIGYVPQGVELLEGTVAENIARFEKGASSASVIAAARAADVHDMILRLPKGYETEIGESGSALSAGQRQRIGLARALYCDPFLIVLDEPNSNLDAEGDVALSRAIAGARERGAIVIVIAHRPSALSAVELIGVMANGSLQAFGPKEEVLRKATRQPAASETGMGAVIVGLAGQRT